MIAEKKIFTLFVTLLLCFSLAAPVMGYEMSESSFEYIKNKLKDANVNIPDEILRNMSGWDVWVEDQYIDPESKATYGYYDHDVDTISGIWVIVSWSESKEDFTKIIEKSNKKDPSPKEMIAFLNEFEAKYPVKRVRAGRVDFITFENKDVLLSEISVEDRQMIQTIERVILDGLENNNKETPGFKILASVLGIFGALICLKWTQRRKM
jgi:hypothetical protein